MVLEQLNIRSKKTDFNLILTPYVKLLKIDHTFKGKTVTTFKRSHRKNIMDPGLGEDFLDMIPIAQSTRGKDG